MSGGGAKSGTTKHEMIQLLSHKRYGPTAEGALRPGFAKILASRWPGFLSCVAQFDDTTGDRHALVIAPTKRRSRATEICHPERMVLAGGLQPVLADVVGHWPDGCLAHDGPGLLRALSSSADTR